MPLEIKVSSPCFCFFTQRRTLYNSQWSEGTAMRSFWEHLEEQNHSTSAKWCWPDWLWGTQERGGDMLDWAMREPFLKASSKGKRRPSSSNSSPITLRWEPLNQVPPETNWKLVEHNIDDNKLQNASRGAWGQLIACVAQTELRVARILHFQLTGMQRERIWIKENKECIPLRGMVCSLSWRPTKTRKRQRKAVGKVGGSRPL